MMPFADFLAKCHRVFRETDWMDPRVQIPPLEKSHVFYLGEDGDFNTGINEIEDDVRAEMRDKIPMPFSDVSCISIVRKPMEESRVKQLNNTVVKMFGGEEGGDLVSASGGHPVWVLDRVMEVPESHPMIRDIVEAKPTNVAKQWFVFVRVHEAENVKTLPMLWAAGFGGTNEKNGKVLIYMMEAAYPLANEVAEGLRYITAISHPANYIVKVTPKLTPKESRRVGSGKTYPDQKTPHFLVVDHDVIVRMRRDPQGSHASPIPHERRGHWRRTAERCRHAKLLGKDKIYVRPSLVGEPKFEDTKNLYEVLPDFSRKEESHA